ncbi:MAG: FtsX-like permease family protein [Dehalococcoidia bacterium]
MIRLRSLPRLAVRRMRRNWKLLSSVATGTLVAAAILSATAIYSDAIRDLGLKHAIEQRDLRELDLRITQSNAPLNPAAYEATRERQSSAVEELGRGALQPAARQGMSATFYPTAPGVSPDLGDSGRDRANVLFRTDLDQHIEVIEGVFPPEVLAAPDGPLEVLVGAATAEALGVAVGDEFDLHPFWAPGIAPTRVRVVGVGRERDPEARYWGLVDERLDQRERSWETYRLWVAEATFLGGFRALVPTAAADYVSFYEVDPEALDARNALAVANGIDALTPRIATTDGRSSAETALPGLLTSYDEKLFFTRIPLLVLLLQIGAIVAYYLVMVSTMLVERQAAEIATMRSRGATTVQLLGIYGVEGTILAALAALVGPPIAAGVISLLGPTPAFDALSGGELLPVYIGRTAFLLAGVGALIAFVSLMVPAWRATRDSVVEFKRGAARPGRTPLFMRYYLDVAFVLVVAAVFWRLSQQEELFTETLFGETQVDPILLATPAVFMITVGVLFLRLFPLVLRLIAWGVGWTRSVAILVGMRSLVRQPSHYTRLILLLMFATGVGMFGATFSSTLGASYGDRAAYEAGADVRASFTLSEVGGGDEAARALLATIPADAVSLAARVDGTGFRDVSLRQTFPILAVDSATFADVAFVRDDFAPQSLEAMNARLAEDQVVTPAGPVLPADTEQIGMWIRFPDTRGRIDVVVALRDATGRAFERTLASVAPTAEYAQEWRFYATAIRGGSSVNPPQGPFELVAVLFDPTGRIAAQRGVVQVGPLQVSTTPAPTTTGLAALQVLDAPWPDGEVIASFDDPAFTVIQGTRVGGSDDTARPVDDAPPGFDRSLRYEWLDSTFAPGARGMGLALEPRTAGIYLARETATQLELEEGDSFTLSVLGRFMSVQVAGIFDYFPTWEGGSGFAVMDASRLFAQVNVAAPDRALVYQEAWFETGTPEETAQALADAGLADVVTRQAIEEAQQQDPLIAAGWSGILAIAFASVLLLSAIGFVVYSYLTAQQRGLEFAILRTLGFSKAQIFSVVMFEHLFVIVAGMGLGTVVGLRIGAIMMGFLATDERGAEVVPPFILGVSWPQVFIVWAILGSVFVGTIAAVVGMYFRLAVHRVLRIGDA